MGTGIAILGLNGAGKSTLAHRLAKDTGFYEMDVEDYYFPEQRNSREMALEEQFDMPCEHLGELPFSVPREKAEVERAIADDILLHPDFILAGVTMNWRREILAKINAAFVVKTPVDERIRRIRQREEARFGPRVLEGGDMYEQQKDFRGIAADRDESRISESIGRLACPVTVLDGTRPVSENVAEIRKVIDQIWSMGGKNHVV